VVTPVPPGAREIAASVTDPELPMLTLEDLGVLRRVVEDSDGRGVTVVITPTYSGCPALATMRDDLVRRLSAAGYDHVRVQVELSPAWSTDWISERGRRALAGAGIAPPRPAPGRPAGPVPLRLVPAARELSCPLCQSPAVELVSEFGATPCTALYKCERCASPFVYVKEI
jgi:ring-1,2-phenylacetyl-CoA epoxidase subunit PaaD